MYGHGEKGRSKGESDSWILSLHDRSVEDATRAGVQGRGCTWSRGRVAHETGWRAQGSIDNVQSGTSSTDCWLLKLWGRMISAGKFKKRKRPCFLRSVTNNAWAEGDKPGKRRTGQRGGRQWETKTLNAGSHVLPPTPLPLPH